MKTAFHIVWTACLGMVLLFIFSSCPAFAINFEVPNKVSQGRGFLVKIEDPAPFSGKIIWRQKEIAFTAKEISTGYTAQVILGMPIDAKNKEFVTLTVNDKKITKEVTPLPVKWVTHKLTVAPKYVEPPKELTERLQKERTATKKILATISSNPTWKLPFTRPVKGTISGSFAARRVFNDKPRSPHLGTDMRGAIGTNILAMADGVVLLAKEHYYSGNAVWIDHGQGVISMYGHMSKFAVKTGDKIKQGQKIGEVGATGRVTGPHLHLSLYIQGVAVDAVPFFRTNPLEVIGGPTKEEPRPQPKEPAAQKAKTSKKYTKVKTTNKTK